MVQSWKEVLMKKRRILLALLSILIGWGGGIASAGTKTFDVTDESGRWFDTGVDIFGTRSLVIAAPGDKIQFLQSRSINGPSRVESRLTVTRLIWPYTAPKQEQIEQKEANQNDHDVVLDTPGLHVFVCKVHPYMLGAVIVDNPATPGLDIGEKLHLLGTTDPADPSTAFP